MAVNISIQGYSILELNSPTVSLVFVAKRRDRVYEVR